MASNEVAQGGCLPGRRVLPLESTARGRRAARIGDAAGRSDASAPDQTGSPVLVQAASLLSGDMITQVVSMREAQASFGASLAMFKAADRAYKSLLDTVA